MELILHKIQNRAFVALVLALFFLLLLSLLVWQPINVTPEYEYTIQVIFKWVGLPSLVFCLFLLLSFFAMQKKMWLIVFHILTIIFFVIPLIVDNVQLINWRYGYGLSICWICGFLSLSFTLFLWTSLLKNLLGSITSLIASFALVLFCLETYMLLTSQGEDGRTYDNQHSKYVISGQVDPNLNIFRTTNIGTFPEKRAVPISVAHRELKFDEVLFDVCYTFNEKGHRITPYTKENAKYSLWIFGCSFTFGHGLENNETWPWLLGDMLGNEWSITNYAFSGFGPQQMLTLLEENLVDYTEATTKKAYFLAIEDQIRRNAGGLISPLISLRYHLDTHGNLVRDGLTSESIYGKLYNVMKIFNGSQSIRHLVRLLVNFLANKNRGEFIETYLAILDKSNRLLREKYGSSLTVLLWPDIEFLEKAIEKRGISTIRVRNFLKKWDITPNLYYIHPRWDPHPNVKACHELTEGLYKLIQIEFPR